MTSMRSALVVAVAVAELGCKPQAEPVEPEAGAGPVVEKQTPAPDVAPEPQPPAAAEDGPKVVFADDTTFSGFVREASPDTMLIRVDTIEPFGPGADALAQRFVDSIPQLFLCYEEHPVAGRSWLSVEVGKYGDPQSVRVHLGPGEVDPALEACATQVLEAMCVTDESATGLFALAVFDKAADAIGLPAPMPGQRVESRYDAGCYRWIEEPPCPPRKRCEVDRWELSRCSGEGPVQ